MDCKLVREDHYPLKAGETRQWRGLHGAAAALALAEAARASGRLVLVVTPDNDRAAALEAELAFFLGADAPPLLAFPDWETLPYDVFSAHQDIVSQRLDTLARLPDLHAGVLITPVRTLMQRIAPRSYVDGYSLALDRGQRLDTDSMRRRLEQCGYNAVGTVYEHGEFAVRGSLFDVFPMGSRVPYRIDLFDDEIDSLRVFDPESQRTVEEVAGVRLLPAREVPLDEYAVARFRRAFRERFDVDPRRCPVYQDVSEGIASPGLEYYLPLFFEQTATLFDYLPADILLVSAGNTGPAAEHFWADTLARYEDRRVDPERPLLPPDALFLPPDELNARLKRWPRVHLAEPDARARAGDVAMDCVPPAGYPLDPRADQPLAALAAALDGYPGRVLFTAETAGRREALTELLAPLELGLEDVDGWQSFVGGTASRCLAVAPLVRGLELAQPPLRLVCESQLLGERVSQSRRRETRQDTSEFVIRNLAELRAGAPVVHLDHGVGRYRGLETLHVDGHAGEYLCLEYAEEAKLYVPVADLHLISRYAGVEEGEAPLHRLGSEQWARARRKAAEKIRDTAAELLELYARREAREGRSYPAPQADYLAFAAAFPFEETPDQEAAIRAVLADLARPRPMDRLVCGDVGFGKTEVAMRAAWVVVNNGRQVILLVPTTLLAQQHYESFRDRFAGLPVTIDCLSRFRSTAEQSAILERAAAGRIDILIGTHRLLQKDTRIRDLGLIIVDEEHRFGVRQKERLKQLRAETDILTLTATPIPRTLNLAFSGLRDLSIIATPPARRLSIKTFVRQRSIAQIKEALMRELLRGGQVFYLHNEVKTIDRVAREVAELVPEARVTIAHGQMAERDLEKVMSDFYHKRFNILVCSTIIETGIDIPSANTIIIERADRFGLAQLHQLRGRVGRSHHQAYAYLMTPHPKAMTRDAVRRLEAIAGAEDLGAGFTLASHDMEIRGAGELLGDEQSGHLQTIGLSLYMEMLERTVAALRSGAEPDLERPLASHCEVNLHLPALLPDTYLPDVHERLVLYKRIAGASGGDELRDLRGELIDRFGPLPDAAGNLFAVSRLKLLADTAGIRRIDAGPARGFLEFTDRTPVDPMRLVQLVQAQPRVFQLRNGNQLHFHADMEEDTARVRHVTGLIQTLRPADADAA